MNKPQTNKAKGIQMANTDPRFQQSRFRGAEKPRKEHAEGASGAKADALRKAYFEESARRNQYCHPVVVGKEPFAREE